MDKIITAIIGIVMFLLFVGGLAESIGQIPFILIVIIIGGMAAYAIWDDIRDSNKG